MVGDVTRWDWTGAESLAILECGQKAATSVPYQHIRGLANSLIDATRLCPEILAYQENIAQANSPYCI